MKVSVVSSQWSVFSYKGKKRDGGALVLNGVLNEQRTVGAVASSRLSAMRHAERKLGATKNSYRHRPKFFAFTYN
jgi:hypothetical protein